jgi:hypothetical protein
MDTLIISGIFMSVLLCSIAAYDYLSRKKHRTNKHG